MSMEAEVKSSEQAARPSDRMLRGLLWGVLALVIVGILGVNLWSFVHQKSGTTLRVGNFIVRTRGSSTTAGLFSDRSAR